MKAARVVAHTSANERVSVEFRVNGTDVSLRVPARMTLADALRDQLGLTGTHVGCEHGVCGMCTILVDGDAIRSCLMFACQADRSEIITIEGLGSPDELHPLQEAFGRHHALQCGFCTAGFLMSAYDLLAHDPGVRRTDISEELSGVLCRCTGYRNIIDAVEDVARSHAEGVPAPKNCKPQILVSRQARDVGGEGWGPVTETWGHRRQDDAAPSEIHLPGGTPAIEVNVTKVLGSSPEEVGRVLSDVQLLVRCLPGAELTEDLGGGWYRGRAGVAVGPIRLSFTGLAHVLDHQPDRFHLRAQGADAGGGRAQAEIRVVAVAEGTGTRLRAEGIVFLVGRIAGFGRSLAGDVSRRMFEQFASSVDQAAAGEEPVVASKPPSAMSMIVAGLVDRMVTRVRERIIRIRKWHQQNP